MDWFVGVLEVLAELIELFVSAETVDLWGVGVGVLDVVVLLGCVAFGGFLAVDPVTS